MSISKIENIEQAFLLEVEDLKSISNLFNDLPGETIFVLETSDGFSRDFDSLDEVLNHENSPKNSIQKIEIKKNSHDPYLTLEISFNKNRYRDITCFFSTREERFIPAYNRIIECVDGTKPWYSKLSKADFISYSLITFWILIITTYALIAFEVIPTSNEEPSTQDEALAYLLIFVIIAAVFGIGWLMNKLKSKVFPSGAFAIGQGKKRHKTLENIRWVVIVGGAITLTVSLISLMLA